MSDVSHIRSNDSAGLGKYRVLAKLGRGGMAEVELALAHGPMGFNKLVVIKRILPHLADDPQFLTMFLDEARLAARLNHPNVVQTNEAGTGENGYFMAMEYLEGQALNRILARLDRDGMPLSMHLRVLADALAGLHHAHELTDYDGTPLGVVHRDVSPHNLFITYDGVVKVVDFGIAKARNSISETQVGMIKGKVTYMSPEQARMEPVDRRADIFSVGVMLWEAATGTRLWAGKTDGGIVKSLLAGELPAPRTIKPTIPERLEAIILKALSPDREDRHATAAELQAEIESFLDDAGGGHVLSRDVGQLIAECFASERSNIRSIIDEQLTLETSGTPGNLPLIEQATGSGSNRPSGMPTKIEGVALPAPPAPKRSVRRPPSTTQRVAWMAGGAGLLAVALTAAIWAQPARGGHFAVADAAPAPVAEHASAAAAPRDEIELGISASPRSAMIFLDDHALVGNPFKGRFPRDSAVHQLRIEAPGFAPRIESITLDRTREIERMLERSEPEPAAVVVPTAVPSVKAHSGASVKSENNGTANVDGRIIRTDLP